MNATSASVTFLMVISLVLQIQYLEAYYSPAASSYSHWRTVFKSPESSANLQPEVAEDPAAVRKALRESAMEMASGSGDSDSGLDLGFKRNQSGARVALHRSALDRANSAFAPGRRRRAIMPRI